MKTTIEVENLLQDYLSQNKDKIELTQKTEIYVNDNSEIKTLDSNYNLQINKFLYSKKVEIYEKFENGCKDENEVIELLDIILNNQNVKHIFIHEFFTNDLRFIYSLSEENFMFNFSVLMKGHVVLSEQEANKITQERIFLDKISLGVYQPHLISPPILDDYNKLENEEIETLVGTKKEIEELEKVIRRRYKYLHSKAMKEFNNSLYQKDSFLNFKNEVNDILEIKDNPKLTDFWHYIIEHHFSNGTANNLHLIYKIAKDLSELIK